MLAGVGAAGRYDIIIVRRKSGAYGTCATVCACNTNLPRQLSHRPDRDTADSRNGAGSADNGNKRLDLLLADLDDSSPVV
jgi:hypothetical protein